MSPEIRKAIMVPLKREFPNAEDIEIEADEDVYDVPGKTNDDHNFYWFFAIEYG